MSKSHQLAKLACSIQRRIHGIQTATACQDHEWRDQNLAILHEQQKEMANLRGQMTSAEIKEAKNMTSVYIPDREDEKKIEERENGFDPRFDFLD